MGKEGIIASRLSEQNKPKEISPSGSP